MLLFYILYKLCSIYSEEDLDEGFLVQGQDVGMRLTAMEYWKCAETGLALQPKSDSSIKIVIAEPLPGQGRLNLLRQKSRY